jgi:hypothetical protein
VSDHTLRRPDTQFKLGKSCVYCHRSMILGVNGAPISAELACFEVDHINRETKTRGMPSRRMSAIEDIHTLQVLCVDCHWLKSTCERAAIHGSRYSQLCVSFVPPEFREWFDHLAAEVNWNSLRQSHQERCSRPQLLRTHDQQATPEHSITVLTIS